MLLLNPELVKFGSAAWARPASVIIEQEAARLIAERSYDGPYETLVDVPQVRTIVTVAHEPDAKEAIPDTLGTRDELAVQVAAPGSDARRLRIRVRCVITSVRYRWVSPGKYQRLVTLQGEAVAGDSSPIEVDVLTTRPA